MPHHHDVTLRLLDNEKKEDEPSNFIIYPLDRHVCRFFFKPELSILPSKFSTKMWNSENFFSLNYIIRIKN